MNIFKAAFGKNGKLMLFIRRKTVKRKRRPSPDDMIFSPSNTTSAAARLAGLILRAAVLFFGVFGFAAFIADAAGLTENVYWNAYHVSPGYLALCSLAVAAVCCAAAYSRITGFIAPPAAAAAYLAVSAVMFGNPFSFIYYSVIRIYNFALYSMVQKGYMYFGDYMVSDGYDYAVAGYASSDPYRAGGALLLCIVIGIILYAGMMKRVRLYVIVPAAALLMSPVLVFNIMKSPVGFAFILAFFVGCIVLTVYDFRFSGSLEKKNARRKKRLEKKEKMEQLHQIRKEEGRMLREEADRMLVAALEADKGRHKSRLARKAVYKAARLAKKAARREEKQLKKENKKAEAAQKKRFAQQKRENSAEYQLIKSKKREKKAAEKAERRAAKRELRANRRLVSAAGGFAGFGAAVFALLAVVIPLSVMNRSFPLITPIYNRISIANNYVSAYLSGNDIDLNSLYAYGIKELTPRKLTFDALEYQEKDVFRVTSTAQNNIYLRSWVGDSFDFGADTWSGADYDKVLAYRQRFGGDFTPDSIRNDFYKYVYPSTTVLDSEEIYKNLSRFGFTVQSVSVRRLSGASRLLFVPAVMNTDLGILEPNTLTASSKKYSRYYDGVYSSRFFRNGDTYGTVSYITRMNRSGLGQAISDSIEYYRLSVDCINSIGSAAEADIQSLIDSYKSTLAQSNLEYLGTSLAERYLQMSEEQRQSFLSSVTAEGEYGQFVYDNYTAPFGSEKIAAFAAELKNELDPEGTLPLHDLIVGVIKKLCDTCEYTLTPDATLYEGSGSVLESFLFDVRQGYCTHFATAACAVLRELGIPVRYAEGYIAGGFTDGMTGYNSYIKDSNAHAWIEVYYDGLGWMQYETTPIYYEYMYSPDSATIIPVDPDAPDDQSSPRPEEEAPSIIPDDGEIAGRGNELTELQIFIIAVSGAVGFVLLVLICRFLVKRFLRRGTNMLSDRYHLVDYATSRETYDDPKTDLRGTARRLDDQILDIFAALGTPPQSGELSGDYGARLDKLYGRLSDYTAAEVLPVIMREEFGNGLTYDEMCILGQYLADITSSVYKGLSLFQKIRLRYIKRKV